MSVTVRTYRMVTMILSNIKDYKFTNGKRGIYKSCLFFDYNNNRAFIKLMRDASLVHMEELK